MYNTIHLLLGYGSGLRIYRDNGEDPAGPERHCL